MEALRLLWDDGYLRYDFGPTHPMAPIRLELALRLMRDLGLLTVPGVALARPEPAGDELLATVHTPEYVAAVKAASGAGAGPDLAHGLGTDDDPVFEGMHAATALIAGGTRGGVRWPSGRGAGGARRQLRRRAAPRDARPGRAGSASTTTRPWRSGRCDRGGASGSRTWTSTCTTATASSGSSGTTPAC